MIFYTWVNDEDSLNRYKKHEVVGGTLEDIPEFYHSWAETFKCAGWQREDWKIFLLCGSKLIELNR